MQVHRKAPSNQAKYIVELLLNEGYCYLNSTFYIDDDYVQEITEMQESCASILEMGNGGRSRAYKRFVLKGDNLMDSTGSYVQSKAYNKEEGDKKRDFPGIKDEVINGFFFRKLLSENILISKGTGLIDFKKDVSIGIHQIRYSATVDTPAYSTPVGLHRDDETIVFIHLLKKSRASVGGINCIAKNEGEVVKIVDLTEPMETLIVTKKHFHSVSPLKAKKNGGTVFRDVLIMTFEPNCDFLLRSE